MDWTLRPDKLAQQVAAGYLNTPADIALGIPGALGNKRAAELHHQATGAVNNALNAPDPYWRDDPTAFIARQVGGAAVGLPAKMLTLGARTIAAAPAAVRYAARFGEAVTPITLPLSAKNIAINAAASSVIQGGMQEGQAMEQAAQESHVLIPPDRGGSADAFIPPDRGEVQTTASGFIPPDRGNLIPPDRGNAATPATSIVPDAVEPRTWFGKAAPYIAPAALALGGAAGVRAVLHARRANAFNTAADNLDIVKPGRSISEEVQQLNPVDSLVQAAVTDRHAAEMLLDQAIKAGQLTEDEALHVRGVLATQLAESAKGDIAREAMRTGVLPNLSTTNMPPSSGMRIRSRDAVEQELANLRAADGQAAALHDAALTAVDELNTRRMNTANNNWMPGGAPANGAPGKPARVMLHDYDEAALEHIVNTARADPRIATLMDEHNTDMRTVLDFMAQSGLKSANDIAAMGAAHPGHIHRMYAEDRAERGQTWHTVQTTGLEANSPVTARTYAHEAGSARYQDPTISTNEAIRKVISLGLENDARRQFIRAVEPYVQHMKQNHPDVPRLVRGTKTRVQDKTTPGWTTVSYVEGGKRRAVEVAAPIAEMLQSYPKATVPIMSGLARVTRNTTTGPIAALFGSVQAPASAGMASMATAFGRPKGFSAGMIDKGLQRLSGGRVGLRGDPTFALNTASSAVRGIAAESARGFASLLRRAEVQKSPLARFIGPTRVTQWANHAESLYDKSIQAQMRREGSAGTGLTHDPEAGKTLNTRGQALTPEFAQMAQRHETRKGVETIIETVKRAGNSITPVDAVHTWRMFTSMLDIVSGSAAHAFIRTNQHVPVSQKALHGLARRLAGDPAEYGASPLIQKLTSTMPYSNISIQGGAAIVRAFKNNPGAATAGLATTLLVPRLLQISSAILADEYEIANGREPKHVNYLVMQSDNAQSNEVGIHIPGTDPEHAMRILLEPAMAPGSVAINGFLLRALHANTNRFWAPDNKELRTHFTRIMDDRQSAGMRAAWGVAGLSVSPPPLMPIAAYMLGGVDASKAFDFTNSRVSLPRDRGAPGFTDNKLFNDPVNHYIEAVLNAVGSLSGAAALELYRTGVLASRAEPKDGQSTARPVGAMADQYTLNTANTTRLLPPGMQQTRTHVQRDAIGNALQPIEAGVERITNGWGDVIRPGTIGSGTAVQRPVGEGRPHVHADIVPIIATAHATQNAVAPLRAARTAAQQQLVSIQSSPLWRNDPIRMRERMNAEVDKIRHLNARIFDLFVNRETSLSMQHGRRIRFENVDPQRGIDQFPRLN